MLQNRDNFFLNLNLSIYDTVAVSWKSFRLFTEHDRFSKTDIAVVIVREKAGWSKLGCALTFASEAKFEIEAKIKFRFA
jgi:hypothetical protein